MTVRRVISPHSCDGRDLDATSVDPPRKTPERINAERRGQTVELDRAGVLGDRSCGSFVIVVVIYLGLLTLLYSFQTRVIFPGASTQGQPFAEVRPRPDTELVTLETDAGRAGGCLVRARA